MVKPFMAGSGDGPMPPETPAQRQQRALRKLGEQLTMDMPVFMISRKHDGSIVEYVIAAKDGRIDRIGSVIAIALDRPYLFSRQGIKTDSAAGAEGTLEALSRRLFNEPGRLKGSWL